MTMKIKGLRWWMIGLLTLGTVMNYLARSSLGEMTPSQSRSRLRKASRTERRCSQRLDSMASASAASTS